MSGKGKGFTFEELFRSPFTDLAFEFSYKNELMLKVLIQVYKILKTIVRTLREDQPLRLLLNLLFCYFNSSEPTYKSQCINLLDVIAACSQLNVNAVN